jgi:hypothetical protein
VLFIEVIMKDQNTEKSLGISGILDVDELIETGE